MTDHPDLLPLPLWAPRSGRFLGWRHDLVWYAPDGLMTGFFQPALAGEHRVWRAYHLDGRGAGRTHEDTGGAHWLGVRFDHPVPDTRAWRGPLPGILALVPLPDRAPADDDYLLDPRP